VVFGGQIYFSTRHLWTRNALKQNGGYILFSFAKDAETRNLPITGISDEN